MTATLVMVFAILAAFALGFVFGRIWQIRRDDLEQHASFTPPPLARIPRPKNGETSESALPTQGRSRSNNREVSWKTANKTVAG